MPEDPESPESPEETSLLPKWLNFKAVLSNRSPSSDVYRPTVIYRPTVTNRMDPALPSSTTQKLNRMHRHDNMSHRAKRRTVSKSGDCNIIKSKLYLRRLRFMQDIFTTMVDGQWRWTLTWFSLSFIVSWILFALIWWLIVDVHGDLEYDHWPEVQDANNFKPCVLGMYGFTSCFLFSIETMHTIGYGARTTTEECPEAIFIMCVQSIWGVVIQGFFGSVIFAKMTRPKLRNQTLMFSKYAVVSMRDGELCLMFRLGDLQKSYIIGGSVRALLLQSKTTKEGEVFSHYQTELELNVDDIDSNLFFIWPITLVHKLNADSPLYGLTAADLLHDKFEIIVILDGSVESTGQSTQARTSYMPSEIMWGYRFVPLVTFNHVRKGYEVDYSKFDGMMAVDTPMCSAKELDEYYDSRAIEGAEPSQQLIREPKTKVSKEQQTGNDFTDTH